MTNTTCNCPAKTELEALREENAQLRLALRDVRSTLPTEEALLDGIKHLGHVIDSLYDALDSAAMDIVDRAGNKNEPAFDVAVARHRAVDARIRALSEIQTMLSALKRKHLTAQSYDEG